LRANAADDVSFDATSGPEVRILRRIDLHRVPSCVWRAPFASRLSTEFAPVPREIQASHARLPVTPDDFLYPLRGVRHPCYRICHLSESFHPVPLSSPFQF
jgi:hypothetical protein